MTPDEQQAAEKLRRAISSSFPDVSPVAEDGPMGVTLRLGVAPTRMNEIEAAMQNATMEIMLETGVLVILSP